MKNNHQFLVLLAVFLPVVLSATPVQVEAEDYAAMQGVEVENGETYMRVKKTTIGGSEAQKGSLCGIPTGKI